MRGKFPDELFLTRGNAASVTPYILRKERVNYYITVWCIGGQTFGTQLVKIVLINNIIFTQADNSIISCLQ